MNDIFFQEYEKLNTAQRRAVDVIDGPVMVVAGPGTGKTQVLALRIVNILRSTDIAANNILCLTFTEAGAHAMRERLRRFIGNDAYRVGIYTFHAFCNSIIARYPECFYNAASFSMASDLECAEITDEIFAVLPHGHPLSSWHPDEGYVYKRDVRERIKHIKNGGYRPNEYRGVINELVKEHGGINEIMRAWPTKLSIKDIGLINDIKERFKKLSGSYGIYFARTLERAIDSAELDGKTGTIGDWRDKYFEKNEHGERILKDSTRVEKMFAVADFYEQYEEKLFNRGLYDYEDVIIEVVHRLRDDVVVRNELEERYQYILIDEFQDTNEAQMNLVRAITSNPVHEGRPNVMVVGDDDQAIYKFQGAEISNIIDFRDKMYRDVETIVLDTNYRSHQTILDFARSVVLHGKNRLEKKFSDITKQLSQGNPVIEHGSILIKQYNSDIEEFSYVAKTIRELLSKNINPQEIAVISRKHKTLQGIIPFLERENIPYEYDRQTNVFDEPHIRELILVAEFMASIASPYARRDDLLPVILSFPYFNIPRHVLFDIAVQAKDARVSWAEVIQKSENDAVKKAFAVLVDIGVRAENMPLERLFEEYINTSGFREHYFSTEVRQIHPVLYVTFLASLRTFIEALREWREGVPIFARDVSQFVALHTAEGISLSCESTVIRAKHSIRLLTAHGAKGLEFGNVFIVGAHEGDWERVSRVNKTIVPAPLSALIAPAGDESDDFMRLFYVAITRAKHMLTISAHNDLLSYVPAEKTEHGECEMGDSEAIALENVLSLVATPYKEDERVVLSRIVEKYVLSVTHLNNFLDVASKGPLFFVEQDLLRFPQPMNVPSVFGSAIDAALTELINYKKYNGVDATPEHIVGVFARALSRGRLHDTEMVRQMERGKNVLELYYNCRDDFNSTMEAQVGFGDEGIVIEGARVGGRIDLLYTDNGAYTVIDFKTGKVFESWDAKTDADKIKIHNYKRQLVFYKLLLKYSSRNTIPAHALMLEFVEGITEGKRTMLLYEPTQEDEDRLIRLIGAVYKRIASLDFPDISKYEKNMKGIVAFEDDLIHGRI